MPKYAVMDPERRRSAEVEARNPRHAAEVFVECSDAYAMLGGEDEVEIHVTTEKGKIRKYSVEIEIEFSFHASRIPEDDE